MKSKLKLTLNHFLDKVFEDESSAEPNLLSNKNLEENEIRLAEITRIKKYYRNSFDLTDDGKFLGMPCWDARATYNNLLYPIIQLTLDFCENLNIYLPETFNIFLNNLDLLNLTLEKLH